MRQLSRGSDDAVNAVMARGRLDVLVGYSPRAAFTQCQVLILRSLTPAAVRVTESESWIESS
jgi:hypothetical protein